MWILIVLHKSIPQIAISTLKNLINVQINLDWIVSSNNSTSQLYFHGSKTGNQFGQVSQIKVKKVFFFFFFKIQTGIVDIIIMYRHSLTFDIYFYLFYRPIDYILILPKSEKGFPRWFSSKESTRQCRRHRRHGFELWIRKISWRRIWQPTPGFLPWKSHGQRSLAG